MNMFSQMKAASEARATMKEISEDFAKKAEAARESIPEAERPSQEYMDGGAKRFDQMSDIAIKAFKGEITYIAVHTIFETVLTPHHMAGLDILIDEAVKYGMRSGLVLTMREMGIAKEFQEAHEKAMEATGKKAE